MEEGRSQEEGGGARRKEREEGRSQEKEKGVEPGIRENTRRKGLGDGVLNCNVSKYNYDMLVP